MSVDIYHPVFEGEEYTIGLDYTGQLPPGAESIASATLEAHEWVKNRPDTDVTDEILLSATATIDGLEVLFAFHQVEGGKVYRVLILTVYDDGQKTTDRIFLEVALP